MNERDVNDGNRFRGAVGVNLLHVPPAPYACLVFTPREMRRRLLAIRRRIRAECPKAIGEYGERERKRDTR